jgi:Ras-related protein Rab-2A
VGVEFAAKDIAVNGKVIKIQIWDTAGQEEFKAMTRSYYRSSAAALVVFDLTRKETFRNVARWVEDVKNNSNKDVVMVLVGNKCDMLPERMVSREEALKLARDYEMLYIETSAKSQENIERAFVWPATTILDKVEGGFISLNR